MTGVIVVVLGDRVMSLVIFIMTVGAIDILYGVL